MTAEQICDQLKDAIAKQQASNKECFHARCNISNKSAIIVRMSDQLGKMQSAIAEGSEAFNDSVFTLAQLCVEYLTASTNSVA